MRRNYHPFCSTLALKMQNHEPAKYEDMNNNNLLQKQGKMCGNTDAHVVLSVM